MLLWLLSIRYAYGWPRPCLWSVLIPIKFVSLPAAESCFATQRESKNLNDFLIIIDYWTLPTYSCWRLCLKRQLRSQKQMKYCRICSLQNCAILLRAKQFQSNQVLICNGGCRAGLGNRLQRSKWSCYKSALSWNFSSINFLLQPCKPILSGYMKLKFQILVSLRPFSG